MATAPIGQEASRGEIEAESRRLIGRTVGEIEEDLFGMAGTSPVTSKHGVARVIEEGHFGISQNSSSRPDFTQAGIELKVTPLKPTGDGSLLRPKERLVLCMVDYNSIAEAEHWRDVPGLEKKLTDLLLVWYVHLKGVDRVEFPVVWADLWSPDEQWSSRFQQDFEELRARVLAGEVPSERHVDYLGSCPKHGGGYVRDDPASSPSSSKVTPGDHPVLDHAEKRGWSICLGGMMDVVLDSTALELQKQGHSSGISLYELEERAKEFSLGPWEGFSQSILAGAG